jgi:magnesium transporter
VEASVRPNKTQLQAIRTALEAGALRGVHRMINALHPAEVARLLESLPPAEREVVWELVDPEDDGDVLVELSEEVRNSLIGGMDAEELLAATEGLDIDDLADLMVELPDAVSQELLRSLDHQDRDRLQAVLAYPEDSAGGLMNTDTVTVRPDVTLDVVLRYLRLRGDMPDHTDAIFVVNRDDEYLGTLYLSRLLSNDPQRTVAELMNTQVTGLPADMSASEVAKMFENRDLVSAAVVSPDGRLLGRITVDDVVDVIREEAEHTVFGRVGLDEDDDMFAPVGVSTRRRAVWLGINLATAGLASLVMSIFEGTIERAVLLAVLVPIVMSMGGIAGTQTLTLITRGMALGQVEASNARSLLGKELAVGFLNGLIWAGLVALGTWLWFGTWQIGAVIAIALAVNLVVAAAAGFTIPLMLRRFGVDPALAGGVVLTTITDVVGIAALLGLGTLILL